MASEASSQAKRVVSGAAEEGLRQLMAKRAREACADEQRVFVECTKQGKFHAVLRCRDELRRLNRCLAPHTSDAVFERMKAEYLEDPAVLPKEYLMLGGRRGRR